MKIIALEEHLVTPAVRTAWGALPPERRDPNATSPLLGQVAAQLEDLGDRRLRDMDDAGVDVQVLSLTSPGTQGLDPADAVPLARDANDVIAATVARRPDRFAGFATLPTPDPAAAARELERAVTTLGMKGALVFGRSWGPGGRERNADAPEFDDVYATAARLGAPLYLHPQTPAAPVRDAYYGGFGPEVDVAFATAGIGWHYETGVQLLRLVFAGVFDRHPGLQVIAGHWGEVVLFYLERIAMLDKAGLKLERPVADYFRQNVYYTPSGIFSQEYLERTVRIVGAERVLFAVDYPFIPVPKGGARTFLEQSSLSAADRELVAHGNWERLTAGRPAAAA
ncbi:amidohydrolase [Gemmatimonadetes bacterium T265]|nr:amidohydrolase [Gemmatimonadetes bacterium T265]